LRLRTACDLELDDPDGTGLIVKRPDNWPLPSLEELGAVLPDLIKAASSRFAQPAKTTVKFEG
jgi:hypothetical protein